MSAKAWIVTRSLAISFCLHGLLILGLFAIGLRVGPENRTGPQKKLVIRPVRVEAKKPAQKMIAGAAVEKTADAPPTAKPSSRIVADTSKGKSPAKSTVKVPTMKELSSARPLGRPSYPTRERPDEETQKGVGSAEALQNGPTEISAGDGPVDLPGDNFSGDRHAKPYYHPRVVIPGSSDRDYILVRFEVQSNGVFDAEIVEGTGDIHADARALKILRRWKWLPMIIDGEKVRSVEILRLNRAR